MFYLRKEPQVQRIGDLEGGKSVLRGRFQILAIQRKYIYVIEVITEEKGVAEFK